MEKTISLNEADNNNIILGTPITGILILRGSRTYGKKNGKLLYKCVPNNKEYPSFLVPYEIKNIGFSKLYTDQYVTFSYLDWNSKHPHGVLKMVIGDVDKLENFFEYQLHCYNLKIPYSIFQKDITKILENTTENDIINIIKTKYPSIEDRTLWHTFTIDPEDSKDFDDGFSIIDLDENTQQISIYISNVTLWIDALNIWDSFSQRVSTIYLPNKKIPMLPQILSDYICSLQQKTIRVAFTMDIIVKNDDIIDIKFANCFINVFKNYVYEERDLLNNDKYMQLLKLSKKLSTKFEYTIINDSHDLVQYLMILMNHKCALELVNKKCGIFRGAIKKDEEILVTEVIPEDIKKSIKMWGNASGQYIDFTKISDDVKKIKHDMLNLEAYIHITSPIRRLVDLLNIIKFQEITGLVKFSKNVDIFYTKWLDNLEYINKTVKSIRKVQNNCNLLYLCLNNLGILDLEYDGYIFDKIMKNNEKDNIIRYKYVVYLPELKLYSTITILENLNNFTHKKFKFFAFLDEHNVKQKIRLHMI